MSILKIPKLGLTFFINSNYKFVDKSQDLIEETPDPSIEKLEALTPDYEEWFKSSKKEFETMKERIIHSDQIRTFGLDFIMNQLLDELIKNFEKNRINDYKYIIIIINDKSIKIENTSDDLPKNAILDIEMKQLTEPSLSESEENTENSITETLRSNEDSSEESHFTDGMLTLGLAGLSFVMGVMAYRKRRKICCLLRRLKRFF